MARWSSTAWWIGCRSALLTWSSLYTFVPRDGESMADISPLVIRLLRRQAQAHGDGYKIASRGAYGVTEEPDRSWVLSKVTPQTLMTFEQPLHLKNPAIVEA